MRAGSRVAVLIGMMLTSAAVAAPLDPATRQDLLGLYDRYNKAIAAGKLADAAALRTAAPRREMLAAKAKARADMLSMARMMMPDEVSPIHATLAADGRSATIVTIGSKTVPANMKIPGGPKPGTVSHGEITLTFEREGQAWKFDNQLFGPDPASIKACDDTQGDTDAEYDGAAQTNAGGVIRRVAFQPDHTLVVVRVVDEENCLILPPRDRLAQLDPHPEKLVPWAVIEVDGVQSRRDRQRIRVERWTVTDE